jgi:hypothetical protein
MAHCRVRDMAARAAVELRPSFERAPQATMEALRDVLGSCQVDSFNGSVRYANTAGDRAISMLRARFTATAGTSPAGAALSGRRGGSSPGR